MAFTQNRMTELAADGIFLLGLLQKAVILRSTTKHTLQRINLTRAFFTDRVDRTPCPVTKTGYDFKIRNIG